MDENLKYEMFLRNRIAELCIQRKISEHRLSLELDKSGSYIRSITSGAALPSVKELFNIIRYFEMDPIEFFTGLESKNSLRAVLGEQLRTMDDADLEKVSLFISWITK